MTTAKKISGKTKKGDRKLLKRRIFATAVLVVVAGFVTLSAFVWTKESKADTPFDPFYSLSSGSPAVRIFQPLQKSLDNPSDFVANGQASPGATITLKIDGNSVGTTVTNEKGLWSKSISGVADGDHQITASSTIVGPLAVSTTDIFSPGYNFIDLNTDKMVSSYGTGLAALYFSTIGPYSGQSLSAPNHIVSPEDSNYIYLVRNRNIVVVDSATQRSVKIIDLQPRFTNPDGSSQNGDIRAAIDAPGQGKFYLLYSGGGPGRIIAIDTASNSPVPQEQFGPVVQDNANRMVLASGKLYAVGEGSSEINTVNLSDGSTANITLQSGVRAMALSPDSSTLFASENGTEGTFPITKINTADDSQQSHIIDLGSSFAADGIYPAASGEKLYIVSRYSSDLRIVNLNDNTVSNSINFSSSPKSDLNGALPLLSTNGDRLFVPLEDQRIGIIDTSNDGAGVVAYINTPNSSYTRLNSQMYYNGKLYLAYSRNLSPTDITDPAQIFNSMGVANANTNSDITPQVLATSATASTLISRAVAITPQTYTGSSDFSVGTPITITSPANNESLKTSTPTITGKGPKNKVIQLVVNTGSPTNVTVDGNGNWQTQVTLPKDKFSKITALYNNKRTQLVIPNVTIFGKNVTKNELSIIDGESELQQQAINIPDIGTQNIRINTSAAINPNGQRYYLVGTDATSILNTVINAVTGGGNPEDISLNIAQALATNQLGGVNVYSAQTRQQVGTITLPSGTVPIGITVSPDGKKAMITAADIQTLIDLIQGNIELGETSPLPGVLFPVNLENNTVGQKIGFSADLTGLSSNEAEASIRSIASLASGALSLLSRPGNFNANGSKFYTTAFEPGKIAVIDMNTLQTTDIVLPQQYANAIVINTQLNKNTGVLYASYLNISLPTGPNSAPGFVPGMILLDTQTNQIAGQSLLPSIPLFNFAVSSSGSRVYFVTANFDDFLGALMSTDSNPMGVFADTLPQFSLGVYDLGAGTYTAHPITNTEVPLGLAIAPDDSKVFIPTLLSNQVHVFNTSTNLIDDGNAPIVLPGVSVMFGTGDFVSSATIGSYTATGDYYVPADAPVIPGGGGGGGSTVVQNNGVTQFRYLPSAQQAAFTPQSITVPQQTLKTVQQTLQRAAEQQKQAEIQSTTRNWLIYIFYGALMVVLTSIGITVWRTDMVLGNGVTRDLFS